MWTHKACNTCYYFEVYFAFKFISYKVIYNYVFVNTFVPPKKWPVIFFFLLRLCAVYLTSLKPASGGSTLAACRNTGSVRGVRPISSCPSKRDSSTRASVRAKISSPLSRRRLRRWKRSNRLRWTRSGNITSVISVIKASDSQQRKY